MIQDKDLISEYAYILRDYLQEKSEANLKHFSEFIEKLVEKPIGPEGILVLHLEVVRDMMKELPTAVRPPFIALSFGCLLETLTGYGLALRECIKSKKVEYNHLRECAALVKEREEMQQRAAKLETLETERKRAEEALRKATRSMRMLSQCNQAVLHATEESDLLRDVCLIIVEIGGYRLAWVGFAEQDKEKTVRPVAQAGCEEGYLDTVNITWADTERGRGLTGTAIRTGKTCIANNILTDPDHESWRAEVSKCGYASSVALPLVANSQTFGALNIYAAEPDAFDTEEVKLLTELADNVTYRIAALRTRAERQHLEGEVIRYEELNKVKTDLLSNVSHELRTPLATIKGYSSMLLDYDRRLRRDEKREYLEAIDRATNRLIELIDHLLDMSQLEAGLLRLNKTPISMSKLIREVATEAKLRAPSHKIVLDLPKRLPKLNIDARRIKQVLDNILDNAFKYSEPETSVMVQVRRRGSELVISVADQGIGIPAEYLDRVFDRMYRIEQKLNPEIGGVGLGLSICKGLVEAHNGGIWMESKEGKGSTCSFTLPLQNNEDETMGKTLETNTVLIIEDEADVRNFASRVLELEGYRVLQTEDGDEGLKLARENQVALVLLDLRLPGRDGFSVLKEIKSDPGLSAIPVIVFTASAAVSQSDRARSMGAVDYLVKPLSAASLKETVARILNPKK